MSGEVVETAPAEVPFEERAKNEQARLKVLARRAAAAASALSPLTKPANHRDLKRLGLLVKKAETKIGYEGLQATGLAPFFADFAAFLSEGAERIRRRLGRELEAACREASIPFRVVSREAPVELRLDPFSCTLDFERGAATFAFARVVIDSCAAEAPAIVALHQKLLKTYEGGDTPEVFFDKCRRAWRAARAAAGSDADRVEILDFLPYLALEMQAQKFRVEPVAKNFKGYDRARFAYDVHRLRRERKLAQDGLRFNLGVATGTTATEKKRVIYFEDDQGQGEFKLTIFFTRTEENGQ